MSLNYNASNNNYLSLRKLTKMNMGSMPGSMGGPQQAKDKPVKTIPKLFENPKNRPFLRIMNNGFKFVYIIYDFSRKLIWLVSCIGFMWALPMMFEILSE